MAWPLLQSLQGFQGVLEKELQEYSRCEKCFQAFCSPVNYRRHVRVHRASLNVDKESHKIRGLLAAFWDKLSLEQVKEILALDDVMLKGIPGSSVINCFASSLRKSGASTQPRLYVEVGSILLDIIQAKPYRLPISSQELFNVLDAVSEKTFLSAGTAGSLQNYVFGGETDIIGLDLKKLIASTSFLFEEQLVKSWVTDKEAETLRCQNLLMEEEEAVQKRKAVLLEKKTQKKLRQKQRKVKEQVYGGSANLAVNVVAADRTTSTEASEPSTPSGSSPHKPVLTTNLDSLPESLQLQRKESDSEINAQFDSDNEPVNQWDSQFIGRQTPLKVWKQKCEKCSREFCSPINYRRHGRVHHRSLNVDKVSRDSLAAFWDKLSLQQVKEILAFDDVMLKEIPGSSVINCLASSLGKPGVLTLPQDYVKAGSTLLDVIQAKSSIPPISSRELFSILDDASERTFLRAGTAESLQEYVFDREEVGTIGLDLKNLVASTSFLFEQQLVKAWVADKDAEALRYQKLKQEEAAQRRQAMHLERKRQKKLRAEKKKVKEKFCGGNADSNVSVLAADLPTSAEASKPSPPSHSSSNTPVLYTNLDSHPESLQPKRRKPNEDIKAQFDSNSEPDNHGDPQTIEHPSWSLVTPLKVLMQKCEQCSREFCSPINYRRHIQVHHQFLNVDKESHANRDLLAAFWDKLSFEEVKEILTFDDSMLKDIIQAMPSGLPISSQELFGILDDASERTFLCAGTAKSLQKYVFDGETTKNTLDLKNLVAIISFLFEQRLVKAWLAHKDPAALRHQKLLVEDEEAEHKRQAVLLQSEKQKKLCHNEREVKEQLYGGNADSAVIIGAERPTLAESSKTSLPTDLHSRLESLQPERKELDEDIEAQFDSNSEHVNQGHSQTIEPQNANTNSHRHVDSLKPPSSHGNASNRIKENPYELMIGSIPVTIKSYVTQQQDSGPDEAQNIWSTERPMEENASENEIKANTVSQGDTKTKNAPSNGHAQDGYCPFCSNLSPIIEFLLNRWAEAREEEYLKLVLSSAEPPGPSDVHHDSPTVSNPLESSRRW